MTGWIRRSRFRPALSACLAGACLLLGQEGVALAADDAIPATAGTALYQSIPPTRDGIGRVYMGREIAQVMGWQGAEWLERAPREQEERPDLLLADLHLAADMVIADIGAGSGYLTRRLAPLVPQGHVYAVDVQPQMVEMLQGLARATAMKNVLPVLGTNTDVRLPPSSVDLAILVDVYHELEFPVEVTRSLVRALKPHGKIVFVEYRGEDPQVAIKPLHKMSVSQLRREMSPQALQWERTDEPLPLQHIVVFSKR